MGRFRWTTHRPFRPPLAYRLPRRRELNDVPHKQLRGTSSFSYRWFEHRRCHAARITSSFARSGNPLEMSRCRSRRRAAFARAGGRVTLGVSCFGGFASTSTRPVSSGDRYLLLIEGDVAAVILANPVERRWVRVGVTPRSIVMSGTVDGDVVVLADAFPWAGIRRRAVTEHAGADRGGRKVVVALDGDEVGVRSIRHACAIDDGLHVLSLLTLGNAPLGSTPRRPSDSRSGHRSRRIGPGGEVPSACPSTTRRPGRSTTATGNLRLHTGPG